MMRSSLSLQRTMLSFDLWCCTCTCSLTINEILFFLLSTCVLVFTYGTISRSGSEVMCILQVPDIMLQYKVR